MFYNGVRLGDVLAWGFGLNDASGNHIDGSPVVCIVRRAGLSAAAPAIASISATNLSTNYYAGSYEVVFSVSADAYSVSVGENYLVYAFASASGLSSLACIGGFRIAAPAVNVVRVDNASATAALSAIVYVAATSAMRDVGVTSAQAVSAVARQALIDYDVPTSADVSVIVAAIAMTSASLSAQVRQVLVDYDVPTSADVSAIVTAVVAGALANYDVPTSADVSAIATAVVAGALANYQAVTSAGLSVQIADSWRVFTLTEPTTPPAAASTTPANALAWLNMLATQRQVQSSTNTIIQNGAGVEIASASVAYDGTTFTRGPWVG